MPKIKILLENSAVNKQFKTRHGLSVWIEHNGRNILLDAGPDNKFLINAKKMNIDVSGAAMLFLSHNHSDHSGGINDFFRVNKTASVYLMDSVDNRYYVKKRFLSVPVGLKLKSKYRSGITQLKDDLNIDNRIFFLKNTIDDYAKPTYNKALFKKENRKLVKDTFEHEGILVLEDNNELLIFNSCSHNGILNIIETVKRKIPGKKIRAYAGGLHLCSPGTKKHETPEYLDYLAEKLKALQINIYTGHCTGKFVLGYLKEKLGNMFHEINTGMELEI